MWDARGDIAYVTKESAKSVLYGHPLEKSEYVDELKEALERGDHIDLGEFYLKSQYLDGRLEETHMCETLDGLDTIEADTLEDKEKLETLDVLSGLRKRGGKHDDRYSYLSTIVLEGLGDCHAREKREATIIHRVYPDMEMLTQKVKINGVKHTRLIVKVEGQWRSMDDIKGPPLTEDDLAGTVLYEKYDYVKHYVGQNNLGNYRKPPKPINSHTKLSVTDDYLDLPLPDGVDADDIKDVAFDASKAGGAGLGGVGQGVIGSPTQVGENGQSNIGVAELVRDPIELEILTADDVEKNRSRTRGILGHWAYLNTNSFMMEEELRLILPKMNDSCFDVVAPVVKAGSKSVLENCKMHESSGLLSCEGGLDGLVPDEVKRKNFADLSCLPANLDRCRPVDYKTTKYFLYIASYLEMVFVLSLERMFKDPLYGEIDLEEEVRRVALEIGVIEPSVYEKLVYVIHHGHRFAGVVDGIAHFKGANGELRSFNIGKTFDDFYCYDPSAQIPEWHSNQ